jgi:hypothetical protein
VLEFLYTDEIDNTLDKTPDVIMDLFVLAKQYDLPRLIGICESVIGYNLDGNSTYRSQY